MKRLILLAVLSLALVGCVKAQSLSYRPAGSTAAAWHVQVVRDGRTFIVKIDNKEAIRSSAGLFATSVDAEGKHGKHAVALRVRQEFEIFKGNHWVAQVYVDRELVGTADL